MVLSVSEPSVRLVRNVGPSNTFEAELLVQVYWRIPEKLKKRVS
jgi:hypothetical protein